MKNPRDIIIRPIITEKTMSYSDSQNKVTFEVARGSNKTEVKHAVEAIFNVNVVKVNIMNVKPKTKRVGKYTGTTRNIRKAIITIAADQKIELI